jgi:heat-inducible transcriptional repressor
MPPGPPIGEREREILTAIVETFIATGEPVGSRTLARANREGLSPATIRNVMSDLADSGYLEQPHTSAGRVPSTDAYRYYVEQLTGKARLSNDDENIIQESFHGVSDVQEFMERTSHVLSLISRNVGVAVAIGGPKNALEHVYFSRLIWMRRLASSTRASAAGPWRQCGASWLDGWSKSAANTTA